MVMENRIRRFSFLSDNTEHSLKLKMIAVSVRDF
jgi:hypothetical protein